MDWVKSLRGAIEYMEEHILEPIGPEETARAVSMSPFYLQKGFQIVTGYGLGEYLRNRRLYLAALDLLAGEEKVIDIAYKYCYQTPESFAKAFARFHGFPPSQIRRERVRLKPFLPLKVKISIQGGNNMDYIVEKMDSFQVIGFAEEIPMERGYELCPKFWDRVKEEHFLPLWNGKPAETSLERAIVECNIGMYGVCIEDGGNPGAFTYLAAGRYDGRPVPEGLEVARIPAASWAKFRAVGPLPVALQSLNSQIFQEWLPGNEEYDLAFPINIEFYTPGESGADYESAIWLPVKEKSHEN
ncbi:AraC family transcriptional regulator [Acutalibacter sp. 1XD8-33]|nr:AraC family transcriptional regulator [Acutalibacter sp. 1XD8-33]